MTSGRSAAGTCATSAVYPRRLPLVPARRCRRHTAARFLAAGATAAVFGLPFLSKMDRAALVHPNEQAGSSTSRRLRIKLRNLLNAPRMDRFSINSLRKCSAHCMQQVFFQPASSSATSPSLSKASNGHRLAHVNSCGAELEHVPAG